MHEMSLAHLSAKLLRDIAVIVLAAKCWGRGYNGVLLVLIEALRWTGNLFGRAPRPCPTVTR